MFTFQGFGTDCTKTRWKCKRLARRSQLFSVLWLHQTGGAAGAPLCATAQLIILASQAERYQPGRSHHARWGGGSTSACRSMAIAVSEEMLYKDKCPLVGVGLVYTPPYVPRVQFSVAYMNLGAWRDATEESEDRLVGTRLMFIHASEASEFLPVAEEHPVLLDVCDTEVLGNIETCVPPLSLRGFKLHTVWILPPEGDRARNIVSPRFEGGLASNLILYDEETVPPELGPQPPMRISLCASSQDHWTIALDTVFPSTLEEHRRIRSRPPHSLLRREPYPQAAPVLEMAGLRPLRQRNELYRWPTPSWTRSMPFDFDPCGTWGVLGTWTGH